jgi:hypothetical protein
MFLKTEDLFGQAHKGTEVIGGKYFSLEDGEKDFDLVQPVGMNGKMNNNDLGRLALKSIDRGQSPVRRPIVKNPENPSGGGVWFAGHDILNQPIKGYDPGLGLAPSERFCLHRDIPSRQPSQVFDKDKDSIVIVKTLNAQGKTNIQGSGVLVSSGNGVSLIIK